MPSKWILLVCPQYLELTGIFYLKVFLFIFNVNFFSNILAIVGFIEFRFLSFTHTLYSQITVLS